jgi:hypothetical protein
MRHLPRYLLILIPAIILMLPAGWCCSFPRLTHARPIPVSSEGCCSACCPSPLQDESDEPARAPSCSCLEQDRLSKQDRTDLNSVDLVTDLAVASLSVVPVAPVAADGSPPPKRPLHVLRCVWLC